MQTRQIERPSDIVVVGRAIGLLSHKLYLVEQMFWLRLHRIHVILSTASFLCKTKSSRLSPCCCCNSTASSPDHKTPNRPTSTSVDRVDVSSRRRRRRRPGVCATLSQLDLWWWWWQCDERHMVGFGLSTVGEITNDKREYWFWMSNISCGEFWCLKISAVLGFLELFLIIQI